MPHKRVFTINQGDRRPSLRVAPLSAETGAAIASMSGATATFTMRRQVTGLPKTIDSAAAVVELNPDDSLLAVRYDWGASDTATPGEYRGNFVVTDPSGLELTFPNEPGFHYIEIVIRAGSDD